MYKVKYRKSPLVHFKHLCVRVTLLTAGNQNLWVMKVWVLPNGELYLRKAGILTIYYEPMRDRSDTGMQNIYLTRVYAIYAMLVYICIYVIQVYMIRLMWMHMATVWTRPLILNIRFHLSQKVACTGFLPSTWRRVHEGVNLGPFFKQWIDCWSIVYPL